MFIIHSVDLRWARPHPALLPACYYRSFVHSFSLSCYRQCRYVFWGDLLCFRRIVCKNPSSSSPRSSTPGGFSARLLYCSSTRSTFLRRSSPRQVFLTNKPLPYIALLTIPPPGPARPLLPRVRWWYRHQQSCQIYIVEVYADE